MTRKTNKCRPKGVGRAYTSWGKSTDLWSQKKDKGLKRKSKTPTNHIIDIHHPTGFDPPPLPIASPEHNKEKR